ncbi:hypothetical protein FHR32_003157 [Streptosporangium album]|uniref:Uncharacterized protein n=1 Tax=Streptosporangium album TaxID=47479 RepID=A0A7W7RVE8_9ACTN|nr:hypothetical protein [Streptosporangium album]MBB4938852.1 hypothetical protein [Streptosporangium album]
MFGLDTPAGARLEETRRFFAFLRDEVPRLMHKWNELNARDERGTPFKRPLSDTDRSR